MKAFLFAVMAVLALAVIGFADDIDTNASTPVLNEYTEIITHPATLNVQDKGWWFLNVKNGDRLAIPSIKLFKQRVAYRNNKWYALNDMCKGSDSLTYKCIWQNTSIANRKPITGANWATYWVNVPSNELYNVNYVFKDTNDMKDFDIRVELRFIKKEHSYDSIPN